MNNGGVNIYTEDSQEYFIPNIKAEKKKEIERYFFSMNFDG